MIGRIPPNYETPEQLIARRKPLLQRSLQTTAATSFGPVPFHGPGAERKWLEFIDLYVKLQREVDGHIGGVLDALESQPDVAANTVIVFTSDHGEYGASHGLRGKGAGAYEEALRVPLIVKDPRGVLTTAPQQARTQLSSSVDVAPLLLTIAQRLQRVARAIPTTRTSPTASTSRRSSPTPPLPGAPTCCTPPTRS